MKKSVVVVCGLCMGTGREVELGMSGIPVGNNVCRQCNGDKRIVVEFEDGQPHPFLSLMSFDEPKRKKK